MAEDNSGISPLDPLGPEFGKINPPSVDIQGVSPFEGSRLTDPRINFPMPKPFVPAVPGLNLTQPQQNIRQNIVGSPDNPARPTNNDDLRQAHIDYVKSIGQANKEKDSYAKLYSYDASPDGNAFYKRYMAYGAETFDKIGFSPLRDNEANFNAKTTMWDDWGRMMKHSFWPLFSRGFVSGPKSLMRMLGGDFSGADLEDAEAFEEAAAIGQSTKGGVSAFFNNTVMNFGYTAGIISEAIVEELALAALTVGTAGGASPVLFSRTMQNLNRVFTSFKGFNLVRQGVKPIAETLRRAGNLEDARKIWSAAKTPTAKAIGRFVNPLENTFEAFKAIKADNITGLARLSKTGAGLYRDLRTVNMAVSEARLEAGMVENKVYRDLYNEHYKLTGEAPDNETQKQMRQQAKNASFDTFTWNAALIYGSNKITFSNITGPRGGLNRYIKSVTEDFAEVGSKYGSLGKIVYDNAKKEFAFEARNLKNLAKSWWRQPGLKTAKQTIGYFKANISEGLQENFQEVIARVNENYYKDSFSSPYRQSHEYAKGVGRYLEKSKGDYRREELSKEFSLEGSGLETFASGFFMGMFAYPLNNAVPFLSEQINRVKDPEAFEKYKNAKEKATKGLVDELNNIDIKEFLNSKVFTASAQDIIAMRRQQSGDKKTALDTEFESMIEAVSAMINSKTTTHFTETLNTFLNFTDEEFMKEFNITKEEIPAFKTRITNATERLNQIQKSHDYYMEKFPNPVNNVNLDDMDPESDEYKDLVALDYGWNLAIKNAVYFRESFNDTMQRMHDVMNKFTSSTFMKNTAQSEMRLLFEPDSNLRDEIYSLTQEIDSLEQAEVKDPRTTEQLKLKKRKLADMTKFAEAYRVFDIFYNRSKYYKNIRENNPELKDKTDDELADILNTELGAIDDEVTQGKIIGDLKDAFDNYLSNLAADNKDYTFDENLEESFNLLLDHYKLGSEAQDMSYFINMIHNPKNFNELAERNRQWMRELYERRTEYYEGMVKREIENIEDNALLNRLADKGLFISVEDLEAWKKSRIIPEEFFDNVNKKVIKEGSLEYDRAASYFIMVANTKVDDVNVTGEVLDKELQQKIDALNLKMQSEIDELEKEEKVNQVGTIVPTSGSAFFTVSKITKEAKPGETITVTTSKGDTLTYTIDADNNVLDEEGNTVTGKTRYVEATRTKVTYEPNPEAVKEIETKYSKLKQELIDDYNAKKSEVKKPKVFEDLTIEELKASEPELFNELYAAFEKSTIEDLGQAQYDILSDTQKENLLSRFIGSAQAKLMIADYKKKKKLGEEIGEIQEEEFEITIDGKTVATATADVKKLRSLIKTHIKLFEKLKKKSVITEDDKLKLLEYQNIINKLNGLIAKRLKAGMTAEMKEAVDYIEKNLISKQKQVQKQNLDTITISEDEQPLNKWKTGEVRFTRLGIRVEKTDAGYDVDGKIYPLDTDDVSVNRVLTNAIYFENPKDTPNAYVINGEVHERVSNVLKAVYDPFTYTNIDTVNLAFDSTIGNNPLSEANIDQFIDALKEAQKAKKLGGFNSNTFKDLKDTLLSIYDAQQIGYATGLEATKEGIRVGAELSETAKKKLAKLGFSNEMMTSMTKEEQELAKTFSSKQDAQELINTLTDRFKLSGASDIETQKAEIEIDANGEFVPKKYSISRKGDNPAPNIPLEAIDPKSFAEEELPNNVKQVRLLEIRGRNADGQLVGKVLIQKEDGGTYEADVFFNDAELAALGETTTAGVFTPTTVYGTPKGPQLTTAQPEAVESQEKLKNFVGNTVAEITYEASKKLGTYLDVQLKEIIANRSAQRDPERISEEAFDSLFDPDTGYLTDIAKRASKGEFKIYTDVVVWSEFPQEDGTVKRVAGEIDLLVVDTNGNMFIIDLKTGKHDKWVGYNNPNSTWAYPKKQENTRQQVAYANLLFNQIDKTAGIGILPIELVYNEETLYIEQAKRPITKQLFKNEDMTLLEKNKPFTVVLSKEMAMDIKDAAGNIISTTAQDLVDSIMPRKELVVEEVPRESASDEESPAVTSQTTKPTPITGTKAQKDSYDSLKSIIVSASVEQLMPLAAEVEIAYNANAITEGMRDDLLNIASDRFNEIFIDVTFEEAKISEKTIKLKDKLVLIAEDLTVETLGKTKQEITPEMGTEFTISKIDSKAKNVTLEGKFGNKNIKFMMPISDLSKSFMKDQDISSMPEQISEPTLDELDANSKAILEMNQDSMASFMESPEKKKDAIAKAKTQSSKDVLDELRKLPKCND